MAIYSFEIGSSYATMTNLEDLDPSIPAPRYEIVKWSETINLASGKVRGNGYPIVSWSWGFLTQSQRDKLREYCTDASSDIYIKTINDDGDYQVYSGIMTWPQSEDLINGKIINFELQFLYLVEYAP